MNTSMQIAATLFPNDTANQEILSTCLQKYAPLSRASTYLYALSTKLINLIDTSYWQTTYQAVRTKNWEALSLPETKTLITNEELLDYQDKAYEKVVTFVMKTAPTSYAIFRQFTKEPLKEKQNLLKASADLAVATSQYYASYDTLISDEEILEGYAAVAYFMKELLYFPLSKSNKHEATRAIQKAVIPHMEKGAQLSSSETKATIPSALSYKAASEILSYLLQLDTPPSKEMLAELFFHYEIETNLLATKLTAIIIKSCKGDLVATQRAATALPKTLEYHPLFHRENHKLGAYVLSCQKIEAFYEKIHSLSLPVIEGFLSYLMTLTQQELATTQFLTFQEKFSKSTLTIFKNLPEKTPTPPIPFIEKQIKGNNYLPLYFFSSLHSPPSWDDLQLFKATLSTNGEAIAKKIIFNIFSTTRKLPKTSSEWENLAK